VIFKGIGQFFFDNSFQAVEIALNLSCFSMVKAIQKNRFKELLLKWNRDKNTRNMPWKNEKDPYKIWLSEIILQQTRVEQGTGYYHRFIKTFPDVHKLAKAPPEKVFKLWEGLGYYTRCRNLIATAKFISKNLKGKFPGSYEEIKSLKGIGPYTAAAISSFAFKLPYAVVDGNVYRVLSRFFGIDIPADSAAGKKYFNELANELLDKKEPGLYNQAIMDFGAVVCKPASPICTSCVFKKNCIAFLTNRINDLPVKGKKIVIKNRWFYYMVLKHGKETFIKQRTEKDIWQQLYEFVLIEEKKKLTHQQILKHAERFNRSSEFKNISPLFKQKLSHRQINTVFIQIELKFKPKQSKAGIWIKENELKRFAFPGVIRDYLKRTEP
jgi:A/G-specific adenine glycosylase